MSRTKTTFARRALASVGAAALGLMGVIGLSATAMAEGTPTYGNINEKAEGSLTVNKLVGTAGANTPLGGVTFNIQKCTGFDIGDPADWAAIRAGGANADTCANLGGTLDDTVSETTGTDGQAVFQGLEVGAYWVTEDQETLPEGVSGSVSFWVTIPYPETNGWLYDVVVNPKNTISGAGDKTADLVTGLQVNAIVDWTLTSPVLGSTGIPAGSKSFEVTDTYGTYQEYVVDSATLEVWYPDATEGISATEHLVSTNAPATSKVTFSYDWTNVTPTYPAGTKFVLKYKTKITGMPDSGEIDNDTPWGTDATYWGSFTGKKVSTGGAALSGAEFELYEGACDASPLGLQVGGVITSGSDGTIASGQLFVAKGKDTTPKSKAYCLIETKAPAGFVLPNPALKVDIALTPGDNSVTLVDIRNTPETGPTLPSTGASGTMLMTVGGIALVAVAGGLFMVTRRKADQK